MSYIAQQVSERRGTALHHNVHWQAMNAEQKMALYNLHPYGYRLLFVRQLESGPLAIVAQQNDIATITEDGDIDYQPEIQIRH
ncbi:hypothetical protein [Shewanella gelidii]|uniref:Uncharacterized protein n=1 Tax=Shewanella gelidii TaxID=1642821 RepID=A0A917JQY3_9GAMM|nr:hypothetical protein [Shewanella gelidii]MCL1099519.1 hypothetical protein [Shewanella gelidii]GGI80976.1 hypothetical protein GCM10009332_17910 [Shewanella gelidii]